MLTTSQSTTDVASLTARLERLCALLGVAGARLTVYNVEVANIGFRPTNLAELEARAVTSGLHVMADTRAVAQGAARFYLGLRLAAQGTTISLFDQLPRSPLMAERAAALVREITSQNKIIADYSRREEQQRVLLERAFATASIGIWQCDLRDESLTWTGGVYDLFEIPRGTPVTRELTMACYTDASRRKMQEARAKAIASCSDFALDCEIITTTGKRRWMRLTGAVESENGVAWRIFGMKQDITHEKLMAEKTRYLAEYDAMTGLANRSVFQSRLAAFDEGRHGIGTLLLVDLDGFKQINDTFGHAYGDECLRETARRLIEICADADLVSRIGGDEFAILLPADVALTRAQALAAEIVGLLGRPVVRGGHVLKFGASVGLAQYRAGSCDDLFRQADIALYAAKASGRNTSRTYTGTMSLRHLKSA